MIGSDRCALDLVHCRDVATNSDIAHTLGDASEDVRAGALLDV
jgi:hypothetical protein